MRTVFSSLAFLALIGACLSHSDTAHATQVGRIDSLERFVYKPFRVRVSFPQATLAL